jgi:hypothetical protein
VSPLAPKKVALVHVAKRQLRLTERDYRALLSRAGVNRASELSEQSLHAVMDELTLLGFRPRKGFGHRPGFASPAQVALMRKLWHEFHANDGGEPALNAWLDSLPPRFGPTLRHG